jgi:hypothetical protein
MAEVKKKRKREATPDPAEDEDVAGLSRLDQQETVRFSLKAVLDARDEQKSFCARLRLHGWAIMELDVQQIEVVQRATEAAERFFLQSSQEQKEATRMLIDEGLGHGKGLVGYNNPTPAKEVYRLRRGPTQPWPALGTAFFYSLSCII